ncbi:MAG: hypothetical protein ACTHLE_08330 [Agriterribacter sp.]
MAAQIITEYDLDFVEKKIKSDQHFDPEESQLQLDDLFDRFVDANLVLKDFLPLIFASEKGVDLIGSPSWKENKLKQDELQSKADNLLAKITGMATDAALTEMTALLKELEMLNQKISAEGEELRTIVEQVKTKLTEMKRNVEAERTRFNAAMNKLKSSIWKNRLGIYVASGLLAIIVALVLDRTGLDKFSNDFLTITQVVVVFLIQEFVLNTWLAYRKREAHRPELLRAFEFLKDKFEQYSREIDEVCAKAGIRRENIFYVLDRLYDKLKLLDNPTKPTGI